MKTYDYRSGNDLRARLYGAKNHNKDAIAFEMVRDEQETKMRWRSQIRKIHEKGLSATRIYSTYAIKIARECKMSMVEAKDMIERATREKIEVPKQATIKDNDEGFGIGD